MYLRFAFEDGAETLEYMAQSTRRKLDLMGVKIGLKGWQAMTRAERLALSHFPASCATAASLVLALLGCASSVTLTKKDRESIRSISIYKLVAMPDDIYYHGPAQGIGAVFGVAGYAIAAAAAQGPKAQLRIAMKEGRVHLYEIVREQFSSELASAGIFPSIVEADADAEVKLLVSIYGFAAGHAFGSDLKPMLGITGTLTRKDGAVVWKTYDYVTNLNDKTPAYTLEQYLRDPKYLTEAFTAAAKLVSHGLVSQMEKE